DLGANVWGLFSGTAKIPATRLATGAISSTSSNGTAVAHASRDGTKADDMTPAIARRGFRRILCPVDFSRHSRATLRYASALAEQSGGELTVLVVNDPMLAAAAAAAMRDTWHLDASTMTELRRFVYRTLGVVGANAT